MPRRKLSRKQTPWDGISELTPTQEFLKMHYKAHYEERHPKLAETGEATVIKLLRTFRMSILLVRKLYTKRIRQ